MHRWEEQKWEQKEEALNREKKKISRMKKKIKDREKEDKERGSTREKKANKGKKTCFSSRKQYERTSVFNETRHLKINKILLEIWKKERDKKRNFWAGNSTIYVFLKNLQIRFLRLFFFFSFFFFCAFFFPSRPSAFFFFFRFKNPVLPFFWLCLVMSYSIFAIQPFLSIFHCIVAKSRYFIKYLILWIGQHESANGIGNCI